MHIQTVGNPETTTTMVPSTPPVETPRKRASSTASSSSTPRTPGTPMTPTMQNRKHLSADGGDGSDEAERLLPLHHAANGGGEPSNKPAPPSQAKKVGTALFYAASSLGVIFANKIVLSTYGFPSVQTLALLQFASTTIALKVASVLGYVNLLPISLRGIKNILPLSTCYLLNILTGLSATQNLSLPMMVLLRRASILMTMVSVT